MSKDDESQLTVRVEISCSLWSLDRLTWIKMEPEGELLLRSLWSLDWLTWIKMEPEGELLLRSDKTACWSCEGKVKIVQLRNAHHRIDDSEGISEGKAFFLGRKLGEYPSFF